MLKTPSSVSLPLSSILKSKSLVPSSKPEILYWSRKKFFTVSLFWSSSFSTVLNFAASGNLGSPEGSSGIEVNGASKSESIWSCGAPVGSVPITIGVKAAGDTSLILE